MTQNVELTISVEAKTDSECDGDVQKTVRAVKQCLNGNRSSGHFRSIRVKDAGWARSDVHGWDR